MVSTLDSLPRELLWTIIDYVPESVFDLKQTSQVLRTRVNERARDSSLVKRLVLSKADLRAYDYQHQRPLIQVRMFVAKHHLQLFETLLRLSEPPMALSDISREPLFVNVLGDLTYYVTLYTEYEVDFVNRCLGWRIGITEIENCTDERELSVVGKILEGKQFAKLRFRIATISDYVDEFLLNILEKHQVEELRLWIEHYKANRDERSFLLDVASRVRSLFLCHKIRTESRRTQACFKVMDNDDWTSVILDMFSRKIDKLAIEKSISGLLSHDSLDMIRDRLPNLGKPICFFTSCDLAYAADRTSYTENGHLVVFKERSFTIKHITRVNEEMKFSV